MRRTVGVCVCVCVCVFALHMCVDMHAYACEKVYVAVSGSE